MLRARVLDYVGVIPAGPSSPEDLLEAGRAALEHAVGAPGDRSVALDLLAADGLMTLALLAQAESNPEALGGFATQIRRAETGAP